MDWRRISVLSGIVMAMLVSAMDTTIINTTMPVIAGELGDRSGGGLYAWTFASYMIFTTVLAPIAGRLSDLYGRKKVLLGGLVLFLFGSALCGAAQSMLQLVIFRAVQGIGAGVMNPFPAIIAGDLFTVEKRGRIQALFTAMWGLSAVVAPLLGSLFVEYWTWRWIFYVNIPISIVSMLLLVPYREAYQPRPAPVDIAGAALFTAGVGLLLMTTTVSGGAAALCAAGGLALLALFGRWELGHASPLLPLDLFRDRSVVWLNVNGFLSNMALFGASTYLPLYLQEYALKGKDWAIFLSGVAMLGMTVGWMGASVPAGRWILKYGYRPLIVAGNVLQVASAALFLLLGRFNDFWFVFFSTIPLGFAFGILSTVSIIGAQQLVGPDRKGVSTSLQMFARNIGTAFGVTLMGAMIARAPELAEGFRWMFLYGTAGSLVSLATAFLIRTGRPAQEANAGA
ncbi:MFS transporter [Thermobacillus sp. ZCTH02-B1]|uniref:MFS transporter n=1 Tax=Thermobacillus sp. ZCTH02-B1 TaxID=1858795 RepID=UPI0025F69458|nr:MFS transporter [Thermobacillus sp. ZCTH02-B1]